MAGQEVKLLGAWYSPFVHRVEVALKLKGIPYEVLEEDLTNKSPLLLQNNPIYKKVPVLLHNHKPIVDSQIILDYLDETWEHNPLLPQDPYQKAMARFWAKFIDDKFTEAVRRILTTEGEAQEKEVKQATEAFEIIEGQLKGKKFFGGESIGFVDIVLGWISMWLEVIEETACVKIHNPQKYPSIENWMQNFVQLPVIKETVPKRDLLIQYFDKLRMFALASAAGK